MRVTLQHCADALAVAAFGMATFTALSGCGQLWRPFLDPTVCTDGCADLGMGTVVDASTVPMDLGEYPWQVEPSGTNLRLNAIWGTNSSSTVGDGGVIMPGATIHTPIWAVGEGGVVVNRDSVYGIWAPQTTKLTGSLYAVSGHDISDVLVAGEAQTIGAWNGVYWSISQPAVDMGVPPPFWGMAALENTSYFLVGPSTTFVLYTAGRRMMPSYQSANLLELTSIAYESSSGVSYIGLGGGDVVKQSGTEFSSLATRQSRGVRSVWARNTADLWAVGDSGLAMHYNG